MKKYSYCTEVADPPSYRTMAMREESSLRKGHRASPWDWRRDGFLPGILTREQLVETLLKKASITGIKVLFFCII